LHQRAHILHALGRVRAVDDVRGARDDIQDPRTGGISEVGFVRLKSTGRVLEDVRGLGV
jgi:hypothetical protein